MPGVRAAVQRRGQAGRAPLAFHPEQLGEEVVKAVPPALIVERDQEQVAARQRAEPRRRALLLHHGIAKGAGQPFENRRAEHQLLRRRVMRLEYLRHQEIHHVTVRAAKSAHESVPVSSVPQRERSKIEPGRPSLRLPHQTFNILGREVEPKTAVQEGIRLPGGEPQIASPQLEQLTVGA